MKKLLLINLLICLLNLSSWSQDSFISHKWSYTCDAINNFKGGIKTGSGYLGMINIEMSFDTEKAGLWRGGELSISGINTHGFEPSKELTGNFHTVSNIEAGKQTFLHELWYKQQIGNIYFKMGITDLNADFAVSEYGSFFINSSFGLPLIISGNIPVSTFPFTNIGGIFHWEINDRLVFQTSIHKGISPELDENKSSHYFKSGDGWTSFSEIQLKYSLLKGKDGLYKVGGYFHEHPDENDKHISNFGLYFIADQHIINDKNGGKISAFTQLGMCPEKFNSNNIYLGFGLHYQGINHARPKDELGLAVAMANFCNENIERETAIELSYKMPLHKHLCIQPTIQYIINKGNTSDIVDNSLMGILRITIE